KKTGRGFYDYREGAVRPAPNTEAAQAAPDSVVIYGDSVAAKALAERLRSNNISFSQAGAKGELLVAAGDARLYVTDGRTATRRAFETGVANTVLIDLALDYNKVTRLAISVAAQCNTASAAQAIGLLQAAGMAISRFNDVPGLVVMRSVAMLANEAADAVNQGVCDAKGADAAMRLGVNYPCGPLAWADRVGLPQISQVLSNLGQAYGEDRYRVSPLIQHHVFAEKNFHD
ncbi:MAG: 3-hydroxyacyl-CoA dehydrogenase family protein, partial [Rhodoferax sp.]|nr:3-hydroxyacyl-CoA dehydrogenase family protein [Rhodoferax sp.]